MRWWPLWCVTVLGCSSGALPFPWPEPDAGYGSYIFFYDDASERRALAVHRDERVELFVAEGSILRALVYAQSLADLGIEEGPVPMRAKCRACDLLEPTSVWQGDGQAWAQGTLEDAEADALVPDRAARCDFCAPLTPILGALPGSQQVFFAEALDPTHAIAGTESGLFAVDDEGSVETVCTSTTVFYDGHYDGRDLWLHDGTSLLRLDLEAQRGLGAPEPCAIVRMAATATLGAVIKRHWIDGSENVFPTELYVTNRSGRIGHYDADGWRWIDSAPAGGLLGGVLWLGPGQAITVNDTPYINRVDGDTVTREVSPSLPIGPPDTTTVVRSERLGIVVGTRNAGVLLEGPQGWENSLDSSVVVGGLAAFEEGLVLSSRGLIFSHFSKETGHCDTYLPLVPDNPDITATVLVSLRDQVFVGDVTNVTVPARFALLERPKPLCQ